jgi:selenocysteine lyase/cysteine desulfurase
LTGGAAHFDGPGGSQTPDAVADTIRDALLRPIANREVTTAAERNAEEIATQCRRALGDLSGADPAGIIFGRSMTALTFDLSRTLAATWSPGDEIVVERAGRGPNR